MKFTSEVIAGLRNQFKYLFDQYGYNTPDHRYILQALDEIEQLQKRIAELEAERRWIPVSERLPEDSRIYDVAIADYEYSWTGTCVFGKWIGESGKAILGVTHWKYRPQPPKDGE